VHRWPILLPDNPAAAQTPETPSPFTRARVQSFNSSASYGSTETTSAPSEAQQPRHFRGHPPDPHPTTPSVSPEVVVLSSPTKRRDLTAPRYPIRKSSAAERILEKLQVGPRPGTSVNQRTSPMKPTRDDLATYPRASIPESRRHSTATFLSLSNVHNQPGPPSPIIARPRFSRSPSAPNSVPQIQTSNSQGSIVTSTASVPPEFLPLLDGEHHTDELATRFEAGWPLLEQWLITAGCGKGDGDFGRVLIIYR
jgi:hypothetical protein